MLSVIMLNVIMLNVNIVSVFRLSVEAPSLANIRLGFKYLLFGRYDTQYNVIQHDGTTH
jgi:hypothetical protein